MENLQIPSSLSWGTLSYNINEFADKVEMICPSFHLKALQGYSFCAKSPLHSLAVITSWRMHHYSFLLISLKCTPTNLFWNITVQDVSNSDHSCRFPELMCSSVKTSTKWPINQDKYEVYSLMGLQSMYYQYCHPVIPWWMIFRCHSLCLSIFLYMLSCYINMSWPVTFHHTLYVFPCTLNSQLWKSEG